MSLPDVLVVGGGPVGLVTAIHAALAGMKVQLIEARTPSQDGLDKACGEGLMPMGVRHLEGLGVSLDPSGTHPFTGIIWKEGGHRAEATFPHGQGLGVRRLALHRGLVARATELGVELRFGLRAQGLCPGGVFTEAGPLNAGLVVGADGLHSKLRKWAGLHRGVGPTKRFGLRRHVELAPWTDRVEVHLGPQAECYLTPVGPNELGVAFLWSGFKANYQQLLARFPQVAQRVGQAPQRSRDMGSGPLEQRVSSPLNLEHRLALVGDAAGYLDACTGEGLSLGFKQGQALVRLFGEGRLERYPAAHRRIVRLPFWMMRGLLLAGRVGLRGPMVGALERMPGLFGRVLAANDGVWRI